ncbi:oxidoreductase [Ensifer sp. ENS04]|uniref:oxidoreductase n=1 Tax=Ensifer sp. ENS04 TaxID=2769281 RepID=UPI0017870078|nr:oxidoreductase [Ensifer sp. ENS04]MBD9542919.1 oxidoreductase [Ensifer sp. ENS04]
MTPIPRITPSTLRAIQDAIEADQDDWESVGVPAGEIGVECDRAIWLAFRRASVPEVITWRKRRIFERGDIEEVRLLDLLQIAGIEVSERQARVRGAGGHLRGKIDAQALGIKEAPATIHVVECKSSKASDFRIMVRDGVKKANPKHYATMQFYMLKRGLDRCQYMMSNKDDEDLHLERVYLDVEFALRAEARIERIINMPEPPSRLCTKRDDFRGTFCRQAAVCWGEIWPRVHCRTCLFSTPLMDGNAGWDCSRHNKPLSLAEQDAGCPAMLFVPALVPGEQMDASEEDETVTYTLKDGSQWVDGRDAIPA